MKHLKPFNESIDFDNKHYIEVTTGSGRVDYYKYYEDHLKDSITDKERTIIKSNLKPHYQTIENKVTDHIINIVWERQHGPNKYFNSYKIIKFEDEVYFVESLKEIGNKKHTTTDGSIYMCDQLDGLLKYIKDNIY